jgi:alpha-beta hydrolase superfamily lysophospholipase
VGRAKGWDPAKQIIPDTIPPELKGRVFAVGDGQGDGRMDTDPQTGNSIAQNATEEALYIKSIRERLDAAHVDLVVHSMGGLISRYYIQKLMPRRRTRRRWSRIW